MRKLFFLALFLSIPVLCFSQTTWYVDKIIGDPAGPGTQAAPFDTIQAAINSAINGDTVLVGPGTYNENLVMPAVSVMVKSQGGAEATIIDANRLGSAAVFIDTLSAEIVLEGFTLKNGLGYPYSVRYGGGIYCYNSSPVIVNNIITENWANNGGGIFCWTDCSPVIRNNIIKGNTADSLGGGIGSHTQGFATITGNLIAGNSAKYGGGINLVHSASPQIITNNTIVGNTATNNGGGIRCDSTGNCVIRNTILWNNTSSVGPNLYLYSGVTVDIGYSVVQGNQALVELTDSTSILNWGLGMLEILDPMFVDDTNGDYQLEYTSPCVNTGINTADSIPDTDLVGENRIVGGTVDIGAYETTVIDSDDDGLTDEEEINVYFTDPNNADTDNDGLTDGQEVDMMNEDGLPDPTIADSDGDNLLDGYEVNTLGTDPTNPDSDDDGITDDLDPTPMEAGTTEEFLVELTRDTALEIRDLDVDLFSGYRTFFKSGRQIAMASRVYWAAWAIDRGYYSFADFMLNRVADRIDGQSPPSDWMPESMEKTELYDQILLLIDLLALL